MTTQQAERTELKKQMRAQIVTQFGDADVFTPSTIATPVIQPGHVLIQVQGSSVNPVDCKIRSGVHHAIGPALPAVLHGDVAGIVVQVGSEVSQFQIGDAVYGCAGGFKGMDGALAEYMLADARLLAHKPKSLNMTEAGALPLIAVTAYEALFDRANLQRGQTILVQGAAGGVGHIAVQLALAAGAQVFTTGSSSAKLQAAVQQGAVGINYKTQSVPEYVAEHTAGKGFDVVMNTVGGASLADAFVAAANNGVVAGISSSATYDLSPMHKKGLSLHIVFMPGPLLNNVGRTRHGEILGEVAKLVDQGKVKPIIDSVYPFSKVNEAHRRLESGETIGKVALTADWS